VVCFFDQPITSSINRLRHFNFLTAVCFCRISPFFPPTLSQRPTPSTSTSIRLILPVSTLVGLGSFFVLLAVPAFSLSRVVTTRSGAINRAAPVGAIVGGVLGGVIVIGVLALLCLFKTGRMNMGKRSQSPGPAATASGATSYPAPTQYPTIPQDPVAASGGTSYPAPPPYPTIAQDTAAAQHPTKPQYPEKM